MNTLRHDVSVEVAQLVALINLEFDKTYAKLGRNLNNPEKTLLFEQMKACINDDWERYELKQEPKPKRARDKKRQQKDGREIKPAEQAE